jgi:hypothetical protein
LVVLAIAVSSAVVTPSVVLVFTLHSLVAIFVAPHTLIAICVTLHSLLVVEALVALAVVTVHSLLTTAVVAAPVALVAGSFSLSSPLHTRSSPSPSLVALVLLAIV